MFYLEVDCPKCSKSIVEYDYNDISDRIKFICRDCSTLYNLEDTDYLIRLKKRLEENECDEGSKE